MRSCYPQKTIINKDDVFDKISYKGNIFKVYRLLIETRKILSIMTLI